MSRWRRPFALSIVLVACTPARPELASHTEAQGRVDLLPESADVWGLSVEVTLDPVLAGGATECELVSERGVTRAVRRGRRFGAVLPLRPGANTVRARCRDARGGARGSAPVTYSRRLGENGRDAVDRDGRPLAPPPGARTRPERSAAPASWLEGAVFYGVIPTLYGDRPLADLRAALPRIAALGVRALWVSPVFEAPPGDFGYAVTDYFRVRRELGTQEDLSLLVEDAHRLGMRTLLDFVPNHTSDRHPYFEAAQARGERSHYFAFYVRDARGRPLHYFDWDHLPNLEFANPEVANWMTASALYWIAALGVDGYRVDAAWGIRARTPSFYDPFQAEIRRARADAFLLAEASARDAFFGEHGFDAAYDWTTELGEWAWKDVFTEPTGIARRLERALRDTQHQARDARVFRFLNNNDTGARFITRHGLELTRVATVLLLTLPGIPCVYAFDEVGGEFEPYDELARPKLSHPELRDFYARLIALRGEQPALRSGALRILSSEPADELLAYLREPSSRDEPSVLVVLNFAERPVRTRLHLDAGERARSQSFRRVFGSGPERLTGKRPVLELPAYGNAVLVAK